jgi:hypothetical protein
MAIWDDEGTISADLDTLIEAFGRARNFPRDGAGRDALVIGLDRAARETGIAARLIVERCVTLSEYCPTDFDLLRVAGEIRDEGKRSEEASRDQKAEWEQQYGKPKPFEMEIAARQISESGKRHWEEDRIMQRAIKAELQRRHPGSIDWTKISRAEYFRAKRDLGYPLCPYEKEQVTLA